LQVPVRVADRVEDALDGADLIAIPVPGSMQERYLEMVLPHTRAGQAVWICQGAGASLLPVARGRGKDALLIESTYTPYSSRRIGPAAVVVRKRLNVPFAAFPARRNDEAARLLGQLFDLPRARDVLEVAMQNVNAVLHPLPCLLNWGQIEERKDAFVLTRDGMTDRVIAAMMAYDAERIAACRAAGLSTLGIDELYAQFGVAIPPYRNRDKAVVETYEDRYIDEDVPIGAVTFASLARHVGVPTPLIDCTIALCDTIYAMSSWRSGRTMERLGLGGLDAASIQRFLMDG
jgi:opine dehydrogenase